MTVWDWVTDFEEQARAQCDAQRLHLVQLHPEAYSYRHTDPDHMLALCEEGQKLARSLQEPWWALFFDHWAIETLIYYKEDYRTLLERVVRTTLESRKPVNEQHPLRFHIYCNFVAAYLCLDPRGYADKVREALAYLETILPPEGEAKYLLLARQGWFTWELDQLAESERYSQQLLAAADQEPDRFLALHHQVGIHSHLCRIMHRRKDWDRLGELARTGEELARQRRAPYERALFQQWQAGCERKAGREDAARRFHRLAGAQMNRLGKQPDDAWFDALSWFHELGGDLPGAWKTRAKHLHTLSDKGQLDAEWKCRLERVRLLAKMGQPLDEEAANTRAALARMRRPEHGLARLERLLRGDAEA
jgi:hypothetical protein